MQGTPDREQHKARMKVEDSLERVGGSILGAEAGGSTVAGIKDNNKNSSDLLVTGKVEAMVSSRDPDEAEVEVLVGASVEDLEDNTQAL